MAARDTSTIVLFDVDGTLTPARKVRLCNLAASAPAAVRGWCSARVDRSWRARAIAVRSQRANLTLF